MPSYAKSSKNAKGEVVRSGFEATLTNELTRLKIDYAYEAVKIPYTPLQKVKHYVPDLILPNGVIVEIKGRFTSPDRQKHKAIKAMYPDLDIRFVFQRASQKINKGSSTTYAMWCKSNGIRFHEGCIPLTWVREPENKINREYIRSWQSDKKKNNTKTKGA